MSARHLLPLICAFVAAPAAGHLQEPLPVDCNEPQPYSIVYGQGTFECSIGPGEVDAFDFFGTPGVRMRAIVHGKGTLRPRVAVLDPQMNLLADVPCSGEPGQPCSFEMELVLPGPSRGVYRIEVSDAEGDGIGGYGLQLERIPATNPIDTLDFVVDSFREFGVLETETDVDQYAFLAEDEVVRISFNLVDLDPELDPRFEIRDSMGDLVSSAECEGPPESEPTEACRATVQAAVTARGAYYFLISDAGHDDAGRYEFLFSRLPEPGAVAARAVAVAALLAWRRARR